MFSDHENRVINIIGRRKVTIQEIADEFDPEETILGAGNYIANVVRRINLKCDFNKLDWYLAGKGIGRGGRTVWKEKR